MFFARCALLVRVNKIFSESKLFFWKWKELIIIFWSLLMEGGLWLCLYAVESLKGSVEVADGRKLEIENCRFFGLGLPQVEVFDLEGRRESEIEGILPLGEWIVVF